jgi:hypothetical protein
MTLELMNDSDLPAKYELIAQVRLRHFFYNYLGSVVRTLFSLNGG